ncbi:MAG: GHKL domain-containing protein [Oscillospiraceae bacterium]
MNIAMLYRAPTYILLSVAETFILHRLLIAFLNRNEISPRYYRQGLFAYFVFQCLSYLFEAPLFSTAVLYATFTIAIACLFFTDSLQMKATVSSIFVILNYACKVLAITLLMYARHVTMPDLPKDMILDWSAQIIACLLFWSCILLTIAFRRLRIQKHQAAYTAIAYIMPIGIMCIVTRMFYHSHNGISEYLYLDVSGILFCTALALFYLLDKSVVIDQTQEQNVVSMQLLTTQEKYYKHLESFQKEMQGIRHDTKNHTRCALSMLEQGQVEEAQEYLRGLYDSAEKMQSPVHCGNNIIDIVLNHSITNMNRLGVGYDMNVLVPSKLAPIDNLDLCTLFGNLLDNAVEACSRICSTDAVKHISINASVRKSYLVINISNTFNGEVRVENNIYQTVKSGERFSGIGLSNIRRVVERYSGEMSINHENNIFTVSAMLALED